VENGADIDLAEHRGNALLMDTARRGSTEMVQAALQLSWNRLLKNHDEQTAGNIAAKSQHLIIVGLLDQKPPQG